jgi:hypothetical protein
MFGHIHSQLILFILQCNILMLYLVWFYDSIIYIHMQSNLMLYLVWFYDSIYYMFIFIHNCFKRQNQIILFILLRVRIICNKIMSLMSLFFFFIFTIRKKILKSSVNN